MGLFSVKDEFSYVLKWRFKNESAVCVLAAIQLIVVAVSFAQHIYSYIESVFVLL